MKLKTLTALMAISGSTVMGAYAALPVVDPAPPSYRLGHGWLCQGTDRGCHQVIRQTEHGLHEEAPC